MIKKTISFLLTIILILSNTGLVYALDIYESSEYNVYYNRIKSKAEYKVARLSGGDRIFYDLEGVISILRSKGGNDSKVFKLGTSLDNTKIKEYITEISNEIGAEVENNNIQTITDYSTLKEKDNIAITTKLNNNLIYGITNEIGTNKFIPFAIIKNNIYVTESSDIEPIQYETILFSSTNVGSDVESYVDNGQVYYPIRFISNLLGGDIKEYYSHETGREKTDILIDFDQKKDYELEYIFSSNEDKNNKVLSKNQCMSVNIKKVNDKDNDIVNSYLYNLDDTSLVMVQKEELKEFLSGSNLENFKEQTGTISICNKTKKMNVKDIYFDTFVGSDEKNFVPTNLTIKNSGIIIKNTEGVTINTYQSEKIKDIKFKTSNEEEITFDKTFDVNTTEYVTKEELSNKEVIVNYTIEFEGGETENGYAYLNPKTSPTEIKVDKYIFKVGRNIKDSNTIIRTLKYKKTTDNTWNTLSANSEGKYIIEGKYSDYELSVEPVMETSSITSSIGTVTQEEKTYKITPGGNIQTFEVVAEDGSKTEYSVTFNEEETKEEKETITSVEVIQGDTKYSAEGPDSNNQFIVKDFDKSKGETVKIKYKISTGEEKDEDFEPNDVNKNTGTLYVKNNVYTVLFKETENIPKEETKETITSVEVIQGDTKYSAEGPDSNNQFIVKDFDKSKGELVNIKYTTSTGAVGEEKNFIPNSDNNNTGTLTVKNNTYTVLFKEKESEEPDTPDTPDNPNTPDNPGGGTSPVECKDAKSTSTKKVKGSGINIRNAPGTSGGIITQYNEGQELKIVETTDGWVKFIYSDEGKDTQKCAYISADYVTDKSNNTGKKFDCDTSKLGKYMVVGTNANYSDLNTNVISKRNQGVKVYAEKCSTTSNKKNKEQCEYIKNNHKRNLDNWYIVKYYEEKNKCGFMYKDQLEEYGKGVYKIATDRCSQNSDILSYWQRANITAATRKNMIELYLQNNKISNKNLNQYFEYGYKVGGLLDQIYVSLSIFDDEYKKTWGKIHLITLLALERASNVNDISYTIYLGKIYKPLINAINEDDENYRIYNAIPQCVKNLYNSSKANNSSLGVDSSVLLGCCAKPNYKICFNSKPPYNTTKTCVNLSCFNNASECGL